MGSFNHSRCLGIGVPEVALHLLYVEQTAKGVFEVFSFETILSDHPTLTTGDFDLDGDQDLVAGNYLLEPEVLKPIKYWINLYENLKK